MMIILPLGHDKEIFRFPLVTVGIILVCLGVQVYSSFSTPDEEEVLRITHELKTLRMRIFMQHGPGWIKERLPKEMSQPSAWEEIPSRKKMSEIVRRFQQVPRDFFREYEAGKIVQPDDPDLQRLKELKHELPGKLFPVTALGYRPGSGKLYTLLTHAFVHGGWFHLIGNMIFLYLCGCNLEDRWGRLIWLAVYLGGSALAGLGFGLIHPQSSQSLVGASGAVAAAMGAFLVVHYSARVRFFYFFWFYLLLYKGTFYLRAFWVLPLWLLQQLLGLLLEGQAVAVGAEQAVPVAYSAHVAGFLTGLLVGVAFKTSGLDLKLKKVSKEEATVYTQSPRFEEGLQQLQGGDNEAAAASFQAVLTEQPDHLDALLKLWPLEQDPQQAAALASRAVLLAKRGGDLLTPINIFRELKELHPRAPLDERGLLTVAQCQQSSAPLQAVDIYQELLTRHPESPLLPKAMLDLARLHLDMLGEPEEAQAVLRQLLQEHGDTPFGHQARLLLKELWEESAP